MYITIKEPDDADAAVVHTVYEGPYQLAHQTLEPGEWPIEGHPEWTLNVTADASTITVHPDRIPEAADKVVRQANLLMGAALGATDTIEEAIALLEKIRDDQQNRKDHVRALVAVETAERLAAAALQKLRRGGALAETPMAAEVRLILEILTNITSAVTASQVRDGALNDQIADEAFKDERAAKEAVKFALERDGLAPPRPLKIDRVPDGITRLPANPSPEQAGFITAAGVAVFTKIADGAIEIETDFDGVVNIYTDTLSEEAAMARLVGLVADHLARKADEQ